MSQESAPGPRRRERPLTPEEVLRRNSVERIKQEKHPYDLALELPVLAATPYEEIAEEDILRLQWWGLYHDKPKLGNFMLRVKIPNGRLTAPQLRAIGELSRRFGEDQGELTTRQDIQLHWIRLDAVGPIFDALAAVGLATSGACGDHLRNITGCPVAGVDPHELFDVTPVIEEIGAFYRDNREYANLPRKHKYTIAACPAHCNAPEIHDVALIGVRQDGRDGFAFWIGGGLSSVPRIGKNLGIFIPKEEALEAAVGLTTIWSRDLRYRVSRAKARFKFMVDDDGPEAIRARLEEHLGRTLEDLYENPRPSNRTAHLGVQPQRSAAGDPRCYVGFPVFPGLMTGSQMIAVAEALAPFGGEFRLTREQNFVVTNVPEARVDALVAAIGDIGFPLDAPAIRGTSIGCTGDPHCNFAVGPTKPKLVEIVTRLEERFGAAVDELRVYLDGCPHACGQHWVGDLGFQGTTRNSETGKITSYDIILRGKLGPGAEIGRPLLRRIPSADVNAQVERLVATWLAERGDGEGLPEFYRRQSDERVLAIAAGE